MRLRSRVTVAAGFAVLLAVLAVSVAVYVVVRGNLHDQIDASLQHFGPVDQHDFPGRASSVPAHLPLVENVYLQVVDRAGAVVTTFDDRPLPVTAGVRAVAAGEGQDIFFDADVGGVPVRVYTTSADRDERWRWAVHSSRSTRPFVNLC